jgi:hypothetical protein
MSCSIHTLEYIYHINSDRLLLHAHLRVVSTLTLNISPLQAVERRRGRKKGLFFK